MASGVYKTLADIRDNVLLDFKESTNSIVVSQVVRWANEAVENWALGKKRDFFNKTFDITTEPYISSTWNLTNGSTFVTLTGTGTIPVTSPHDHQFKAQGFNDVYNVSAMNSTTITLASPFLGTSNTAASGVFWQSAIFIDSSIRSIHKVYHGFYNYPLDNMGAQDLRDYINQQPYRTDYANKWSLYGLDLGTGADQRRLVVYPFPKVTYTLHLDANIYITPMVNDSDEPMVPLQYRQMIYWYCMGKLAKYHGDDTAAQTYIGTYATIKAELDGELMPETEYPQIQNRNRFRWINKTQRGRRNRFYFDD